MNYEYAVICDPNLSIVKRNIENQSFCIFYQLKCFYLTFSGEMSTLAEDFLVMAEGHLKKKEAKDHVLDALVGSDANKQLMLENTR